MFKVLLISILITGVFNAKQCRNCVTIEECPTLKYLFMRIPYSGQSFNFFKTMTCGFKGFVPKVCCDDNIIDSFYGKDKKAFTNKINLKDKNNEIDLKDDYIHKEESNRLASKEDELNKYCNENKESKIIGGITAGVGIFPWMAKLGYTAGTQNTMLMKSDDEEIIFRCGGSLITRSHVLTAAHCITKLPQMMELKLIVLDADGKSQKRLPAKLLPHPQYDTPFINDIGIIKMERPAEINENVRPICLPFGSMSIDPARLLPRTLMVAGWGALESGSKVSSPRLRYTRLTYYPDKQCRRLFKTQFNVTLDRGHLCTVPDMHRDACAGSYGKLVWQTFNYIPGDSGGPLFTWAGDGSSTQAVVLALVSFGGRQCAARDIPGVYTRIDVYSKWIKKAVLN